MLHETDWRGRPLTHRERVERASFADADGLLWAEGRIWKDGDALRGMFWTYYADHIEERNHGRALRALMRRTIDGMKQFTTADAFKDMLRETLGPFLTKMNRSRDRSGECAWCGRPHEGRQRCEGCGAWRKYP